MSAVGQAVMRRWLEVLLPLYTMALLIVLHDPDYAPDVLSQSMSDSVFPWIAWAVVGALSGILGLWVIIIAFFLLYSPIYLAGRGALLVGRSGWVDKREMQFYVACFLMLCLLIIVAWTLGWRVSLGGLILLAGCGPVFWRHLV